jgi:tetratricopeptide (TPR) repeat protein
MIAERPLNESAWNGLGSIAAVRGDFAQALRYIDHALEINPGYAYAHKVLEYIETQRIGRPYDSYHAQIICAYVLQKASGLSATKAMTCLERVLATPTLQPDLTVACGDATGEVTILAPLRPLACRALAFSVARSATNHDGEI